MRNLAVIFTSAALSFGVLSAAFPGAAASPQVDPPSSCINWVPTASVQLATSRRRIRIRILLLFRIQIKKSALVRVPVLLFMGTDIKQNARIMERP